MIIRENINSSMVNQSSNFTLATDQKIALPDKSDLFIFEVRKIIRCQSDNSYTEFIILDDNSDEKVFIKKVVSKGFYHYEEFLMSTGLFYRIHNQHIINVNHLKKIIKSNGGYVLMDDNTNELLPIARARKEEFMNYLKFKGIIL